jgi:hypothetical protein
MAQNSVFPPIKRINLKILKNFNASEVCTTNKDTNKNIRAYIQSDSFPRKCVYLEDYSLDFEHACMTTYLAS